MKQRNALYATLTHSLGLSSRDLAEIGGFSDRFARDLLAGRRPFPADVRDAIDAIQDDIDHLTKAILSDALNIEDVIWIPGSTSDLRCLYPDIPARGAAEGGFIGPYRLAALAAWEKLLRTNVSRELFFWVDE